MPRQVLHRGSNALLLVVLVSTFVASSADGQRSGESMGSVTAIVVDATGAAWVRADVALIDTRTLQDQRGIADEKGVVRFLNIRPSNYMLIASPHPPIDCADSGVKQFTLKSGQSLDIKLTVQVNHCAVVE